jgi:hypothetical protein
VDPQFAYKNNVQTSSGHHASVTLSVASTNANAISGAFLSYTDGPLKDLKVRVNSNVGSGPTDRTQSYVDGKVVNSDYPIVHSSIEGVGVKLKPEQIAQVKKDMTEILQNPDMQLVATKQIYGEAAKTIDPEIGLSANKFIQSFQEQPKQAPHQGHKNSPTHGAPKPH